MTRCNAESKADFGREQIQTRILEWKESAVDVEAVHSIEIQRVETVQRAQSASDRDVGREPTAESAPNPDHDLREGDVVVYHEGGSDSSVYGFTTEGIVTRVSPIERQHKPPILGKIEVDTGTQERLLPLEWVIGRKSEVNVEIDNPRPRLSDRV